MMNQMTKRRIIKFMDNLSSTDKEQALAGKGSLIEKNFPTQMTSPGKSSTPKISQ